MGKIKYHFNPKSLSFEKRKITFKDQLLRVLGYVATGVAFSTLVMLISYNFFDSPKEMRLKREISQYEFQMNMVNNRLDKIQAVLKEIQQRDDQVYRVIFEAEPIPSSVREAGIGGVDYYNDFKGMKNADLLIEINKKLDKTSSQLYVQSKSLDEVIALTKRKTDMLASIPAIIPLRNGKTHIISGFGYRYHPILKVKRMHTGIDIASPKGTPVYASGDGIVLNPKGLTGYGNVVIISHGFGYQSLYAHLSKTAVRPGQKIKRGELVGYVGSTGLSVAPHLHYEIMKNGIKVNPVHYFYNDLSPKEYEEVLEAASKVNQALS